MRTDKAGLNSQIHVSNNFINIYSFNTKCCNKQKENHVISIHIIFDSRFFLVSSLDLVDSRPDLTGRILSLLIPICGGSIRGENHSISNTSAFCTKYVSVLRVSFIIIFNFFPVNFQDIKEIRKGKGSKDFDKWPDDARRVDQRLCFVVYYGNDFKLRTLSVVSKY